MAVHRAQPNIKSHKPRLHTAVRSSTTFVRLTAPETLQGSAGPLPGMQFESGRSVYAWPGNSRLSKESIERKLRHNRSFRDGELCLIRHQPFPQRAQCRAEAFKCTTDFRRGHHALNSAH